MMSKFWISIYIAEVLIGVPLAWYAIKRKPSLARPLAYFGIIAAVLSVAMAALVMN